jgi:pyrroline-5-carboxylate reductase
MAVFDVDPAKAEAARAIGAVPVETATELAGASDALILAVKPQGMDAALRPLAPVLPGQTLVVSIAAGISISYLEERLGRGRRIARVMPNTPALVQAGAAAAAFSAACAEEDKDTVQALFGAVGHIERVDEAHMDAVTALSGSGPAYFFRLTELLTEAAAAEGLPRDVAERLARQTLLGAGRLLTESGESAATLRERVTSKGGTTEAALRAFAEGGFDALVSKAVAAAAQRSRELGQ